MECLHEKPEDQDSSVLENECEKSNDKNDEIKDVFAFLQVTDSNNAYLEYIFGAQSITDLIFRTAISEQLVEYNNDLIIEYNETVKEYTEKKEELDAVYNELDDRFGPIPDEVYSLLALAEIRIICKNLHISTLKEKMGNVYVEFSKVSDISMEKLMRLITESGGNIRPDANRPNILVLTIGKIGLKEKSIFIREKLESLVS